MCDGESNGEKDLQGVHGIPCCYIFLAKIRLYAMIKEKVVADESNKLEMGCFLICLNRLHGKKLRLRWYPFAKLHTLPKSVLG